jgi:hypothetical protein
VEEDEPVAGGELHNALWAKVLQVEDEQPSHAVPVQVPGNGEQEADQQDAVVEGEDAQGAAGVELAEVAFVLQGVDQNAGDKKAGEDEEEVDAKVAVVEDGADEPGENTAGMVIGFKDVGTDDHQNGKAADAVERKEMALRGQDLWFRLRERHRVNSLMQDFTYLDCVSVTRMDVNFWETGPYPNYVSARLEDVCLFHCSSA